MEYFAEEMEGTLRVGYVDIDEEVDLATLFDVQGIHS